MKKTCRNCHADKPVSDFNRYSAAPDGYQYWCRECSRAHNKERYYSDQSAQIAKAAAWNRANPKRVAKNMRECRSRNPEHHKAYRTEWSQKNQRRIQAYDAKKRARRLMAYAAGDFKAGDWLEIVRKQKSRCHYCGKKERLTMDHVVPIARGGRHEKKNIVGACGSCNSRKCATPVEEFALRQGRLLF